MSDATMDLTSPPRGRRAARIARVRTALRVACRQFVRTAAVPCLAVVCLVGLVGCGGYALDVRAVEGGFPGVSFPGATTNAATTDARPVAGASITLIRDPGRGESTAGSLRTDATGTGRLDVAGFGAGWMLEQWRVEVVAPGYETIETMVTLPKKPGERIMLITLVEGRSTTPHRDDPWGDYEQFR